MLEFIGSYWAIAYWIIGAVIALDIAADIFTTPDYNTKPEVFLQMAIALTVMPFLWLPIIAWAYCTVGLQADQYESKMRQRRKQDFELYGC